MSKSKMPRNKKVDIIIALVASVALWAYVTTAINPATEKTISNIPVELTNIEALAAAGLAVVTDSYTVDVTINGSRSEVATLSTGDFKATANVSNFPEGQNSVEVKVTGPDGIAINDIYPDKIEVGVEKLITVDKPISLNYSEPFPQGMEPGFITITPKEMSIAGTKTQIEAVNYVRADVDSNKLRQNERTLQANVVPVDNSGDRVLGVTMSQNAVSVKLKLCHVKEVPLDITVKGTPPGSLVVTKEDVPKTVFIRGSEEDLKNIRVIKADPINITNLRSTTIITPNLYLPDNVELANASNNLAVIIEIGGEEAKSFTVTNDNIEIKGVPEGYSAHISSPSVTLTVFGSHEQLLNFSPDDLKLYIDITGYDFTKNNAIAVVMHEQIDTVKRIDIVPQNVDLYITKPTQPSDVQTTTPGQIGLVTNGALKSPSGGAVGTTGPAAY